MKRHRIVKDDAGMDKITPAALSSGVGNARLVPTMYVVGCGVTACRWCRSGFDGVVTQHVEQSKVASVN